MHQKSEEYERIYSYAVSLQYQYRDDEKLRELIIKKGNDASLADEIIQQIKKDKQVKKRNTAVQIIVFGGILLILGFITTFVCYYSNLSINLVMFGFTTAGLLVMLVGLFYLLK